MIRAVPFDSEGAMRRAIAKNKVQVMCINTITFVFDSNDFTVLKKSILSYFSQFCANIHDFGLT